MLFSVELLNLILYCVQQFGVALGFGAQTIMLVAYLQATRDGVIDKVEAQFLRATRITLWVSLFAIVVSGLCITLLHLLAGQEATIFQPAYLFKWLLIAVVILLTALLHTLPETLAEGLLGGTWYALFLVHILAPVTTWINLLTLWGVWMIGFMICWYALAVTLREKKLKQPANPVPLKQIRSFFSFAGKGSKAKVQQQPVEEIKPQAIKEAKPPPKAELPKIILDASTPAVPVVKLPGITATDTPFLPQVPPLQPIPTKDAPLPQKQKDLPPAVPEITPEIKRGLSIMPKSPGQLE